MKRFNKALLLPILLAVSGCTYTAIALAEKLDARDARKQGEHDYNIVQEDIKKYEAMKANGDPDGYYFTAIIFAKSKEDNAREHRKEILARYEEAVAKGSNDAKIALGRMLVEGRSLPFEYMDVALPWEERDIKRGLKLLEEAATKSCYYQQPLFMDSACSNIRRTNAAVPIWVAYRDGVYARLPNTEKRSQVFPKNPALAEKWKKRRDQCDAEIKEYKKANRCSMF